MQLMSLDKRLPTRGADWKVTVRAVRLVLSIPLYASIALITSVLGLSLFVLSQNIQLVRTVVLSDFLPLENRVKVLVYLYPFIGDAFSPVRSVVLLLSAILFGINITLLLYHFREHRFSVGSGTGSVLGAIFGILGAGCAACGSVVLTGILSFVGAASILTLLPYDGLSFMIAALLVLLLSIYWTADGMRGGTVNGCPIEFQQK